MEITKLFAMSKKDNESADICIVVHSQAELTALEALAVDGGDIDGND